MERFTCPLEECNERIIDILDIGPAIIFTCRELHEVTWEKVPVYHYYVLIESRYYIDAEDEETAKFIALRTLQKELIKGKDNIEVNVIEEE